jgi:hypothetical protein
MRLIPPHEVLDCIAAHLLICLALSLRCILWRLVNLFEQDPAKRQLQSTDYFLGWDCLLAEFTPAVHSRSWTTFALRKISARVARLVEGESCRLNRDTLLKSQTVSSWPMSYERILIFGNNAREHSE